jgi:hypothetical protein
MHITNFTQRSLDCLPTSVQFPESHLLDGRIHSDAVYQVLSDFRRLPLGRTGVKRARKLDAAHVVERLGGSGLGLGLGFSMDCIQFASPFNWGSSAAACIAFRPVTEIKAKV